MDGMGCLEHFGALSKWMQTLAWHKWRKQPFQVSFLAKQKEGSDSKKSAERPSSVSATPIDISRAWLNCVAQALLPVVPKLVDIFLAIPALRGLSLHISFESGVEGLRMARSVEINSAAILTLDPTRHSDFCLCRQWTFESQFCFCFCSERCNEAHATQHS